MESKLEQLRILSPGLVLALVVMLFSICVVTLARMVLPFENSLLSPILMALVLGLAIRAVISLPDSVDAGLAFGVRRLLRIGIVLMGIRLTVFSVLEIGLLSVGIVLLCIGSALLMTMMFARMLGISDRLGVLIAAGTSICGVSAIVALGPVINAKKEETAYAVGTITVFGIVAVIVYPYLTELILRLPVIGAGFFLGTAIHDTSQVTAASLIYDQLWAHKTAGGLMCADIAITTKLVRNTFMVIVIPWLGYRSALKDVENRQGARFQFAKYVPLFVIGYICMGVLRSLGDHFWGVGNESWVTGWQIVKSAAMYIIILAITCVGLSTDIRKLAALGMAPFVCGFVAAAAVGVVSWLIVTIFGQYLSL